MPTASNRGWPTTTAELGPWAATFDSRLQPYLEWFGTVVVACTGQPDRLEVEARLWERSAREWNAVHARLTDSLPIVDGWQGAAAQTFRGTHRERLTRIEAESRRIPLVPKALRTAHYGLVVGRRDAIRVTTRFLTAVRARTASISAATPALAATMTTEVVQDTFAFYQPDALKVVAALRATMKRLALQLEAATPDPGALARWFAPELTRRGLNLVKDHEMPLGWEQTALGTTGGLLNIPAEVARQTGRMNSPLAWALMTAPAGVLRNIASYADLPLFDNFVYQVPLTVGVNAAAVYGSNWLMGRVGQSSVMQRFIGEGSSMAHDTPGKLLINNSITSLLLAAKPAMYQVYPEMRPELLTESGTGQALTNGPGLAGGVYDVAAIGVPAAAIFGYDAYAALRGQGLAKALGAGATTAMTETGVAAVAVGITEGMTRPPEPGSPSQRVYDWWQPKWQAVQHSPAVIATGAAMSALGSEADYLGATVQRLRQVPQVGELVINPWGQAVPATPEMATVAQLRYQQAIELQRRSLDDIATAGRTMTDNVAVLVTGRR